MRCADRTAVGVRAGNAIGDRSRLHPLRLVAGLTRQGVIFRVASWTSKATRFLVNPKGSRFEERPPIDVWRAGFAYEKNLRFKVPPSPSRTVPRSNREPGSGVAIIMVERST
jgi:hypothetical protein